MNWKREGEGKWREDGKQNEKKVNVFTYLCPTHPSP